MVAVVLEAGSYRAYVYKIVRLDNDQSRHNDAGNAIGQRPADGAVRCTHLAIKKIKLHAFTHHLAQISEVV